MTLTYPILNRARCILWLVTGPNKAEIFQRVRAGDASLPASRIRQNAAVAIADLAAVCPTGSTETKGVPCA